MTTRSALASITVLLTSWASAQSTLDSLLRVLPTRSGADRVRALGDVQWELGFSDPEKALAYGLEAMKLAEGLKDSAVIAQAANDLSISEYRLGHFQRSIVLSRRALAIREVLKDTLGVAASHNKLGAAFTEIILLDSALAHNYAAERIYEQRGDLLHAAQIRGNLARLYQQLGNNGMALKVARETVSMLKRTNSDYAMANALGQLAMILVDMKEMKEAETTSLQALDLFEKIGAKGDVASVSNILGLIYRERGDNATGLQYYRRALRISIEVDDPIGQATFLLNVANVLAEEKSGVAEALDLYRRSIAICEREGYMDPRLSAIGGYVTALEKSGDVGEALRQQKKLQVLRDSVFQLERLEAMTELQVKYETERTEKELSQERERGLAQQARIARQRLWIGIVSAAAIVISLLAFAWITRQRARSRSERDAAVITEREQGLRAMVENTDAERTRIAAELHDGVGQLLTGLKYRMEAASVDRPELKDVLTMADDASREVRGIAHRMMPRALGDLGLAPALADMLDKSLKLPGMHHTFEHFGMEQRLGRAVEVGVYRIAQELLNNVVKHAGARNVQVQLLRNKGHLVLIVEDDGVGFDPAQNSNGVGMRSLMDRARILHGTLDIQRGATSGTIATLRVPLENGNRT